MGMNRSILPLCNKALSTRIPEMLSRVHGGLPAYLMVRATTSESCAKPPLSSRCRKRSIKTSSYDQSLELTGNNMGPGSGGTNPNNPALASRQRLRWTHELHECFVDAVTQLGGPFKSMSRVDSFSSRPEPLTPGSGCRAVSPESLKREKPIKRQRGASGPGNGRTELVLAPHLLGSSSGSDFQQLCSIFPAGGGHSGSSGTSICDDDRLENGSGSDI